MGRSLGGSAERTRQLLEITAAIADAVTSAQVFEAVVDRIAAVLQASSTALWLIDEQGRSATLARAVGYHAGARADFQRLDLESAPPSPIVDVLKQGEALWIASQEALLERYPKLAASVSPNRSYRIASLPLATKAHALGALALTIEEARAWSEEEQSFLLLVSEYAGQAVERLRLLEAERISRARADAAAARAGMLSAASRAFVEGDMDLPSRLTGVVTELGRQMNSCVGIALLDAEGMLQTSAAYHPSPEATQLLSFAQHPRRLGEGVTGKVAQSGTSILIPSAEPAELAARAAPAYRDFLERFPNYAMMCAPLRVRRRIIGTLTATRTRPGETYDSDDLSLLEDLADRAASVIENSRLYQENLDARARAEQLYRFANVIVTADRQEQLFEAALDAIEVELKTERAAVLIFDAERVMRFRASRGLSDEYRSAVEGHSPWSADQVALAPVLVSDVETDASLAAFRPLFQREGIGALAFFPILSRGQLLGKVMVYHHAPHRYSEHEIDAVMSISAHLGSIVSRFAAMERLREIAHYTELFAGILAHDLRNPLAAVITAAQVLRMRIAESDERLAKPVAKILSSGQRMSRLIEQLLDVTRARAGGGIQVHRQKIDLAEVCEQVSGELEPAHSSGRIRCDYQGDTCGLWDRDRLGQVLSNLLGNAVQHGRADRPIELTLDGTHPAGVTLRVHNEGAILPELLPTLLDPLRGAKTRRDHARGLGLGLFIAAEVVRAHGGAISVASNEADGTTFTATLPRA